MIGNDVVDLSDPESSRAACHLRFDQRVFAPEEIRSLSTDHLDSRRRWMLWSAKEAAYKAAHRESARVVFSPARFVVDLDRSLCGSVRYGNRHWPLRIRIDGDCVHAVVSEEESFEGTLSGVCRLTAAGLCDPSEGVRRFAISSIGAQLGVATSEMRIEKVDRIPQLILGDTKTPLALSLSHHGSYAGFACRDPRIEKVNRIPQRVAVETGAPASLSFSRNASYPSIAYRPHAQRGCLH